MQQRKNSQRPEKQAFTTEITEENQKYTGQFSLAHRQAWFGHEMTVTPRLLRLFFVMPDLSGLPEVWAETGYPPSRE